jgi:hypothetical protein
MLTVLDPTGGARGDHGQSAAVLNTAEQLVCFLNDGQVSSQVHVIYAVKAKSLESGNHLTLNVGTGLIVEALTKLSANGRSGADEDMLVGICQSLEYLIGIVSLIQSANGASYDTLTAVDAGGLSQSSLECATDLSIKATVVSTDYADALSLLTSGNAATAQNALAVVTNNGDG